MAAILLAAVTFAFGQQATGSISGTVQDSQGGAVVGAKVAISNQAQGGVAREMQTSGEGTFFFTPLNAGTYTVTVEAPGFKKYTKTDIALYAQDRLQVPTIVLEVGAATESVTVEASAVQLQTVSAERAGVVTASQVVDLASSNRSYTDLLKTIPGFTNDGTNSANGLRSDQNAIAVDGVSNMDSGCNCTGIWRVNSDIIAELKVLTNGQQAEFGRAAGANITMVTKGGSRDFHGSAYEFMKNEWMNANTFANNYNNFPKNRGRNSTFGFTLGGPVYIPNTFNSSREKLFFFTNFEFQRPKVFDALSSYMVPSVAERKGDFSATQENGIPVIIKDPLTNAAFPGNQIPLDRQSVWGQQMLNFYPTPNRQGASTAYNYQYSFQGQSKINDRMFRVDYNISNNWRFYWRLSQNNNPQKTAAGLNVSNQIGLSPFNFMLGALGSSANLTTIISPTLTNEFSWGYSNPWLPNDMPSDSKYLRANNGITAPVLFKNADPLGVMPNMQWGLAQGSPNIFFNGLPYDNENPVQNVNDNVSKVWARHTFKAGFFFEHSFKRQTATTPNNGTYNFARDAANPGDANFGYATALLGNFDTFSQSSAYVKGRYVSNSIEWYAQDNWKVNQNLTLDYGVRFSLIYPMYDTTGQLSGFDPARYTAANRVRLYQPAIVNGATVAQDPVTGATVARTFIGAIVPGTGNILNGVVQGGKDGYSKGLLDNRPVQIGPRFGLAWTPFGQNSKTVVRFGGGAFYERIQGNMAFNQIVFPPTILTPTVYYGSMSTLTSASSTYFPFQTAGADKAGKLPTVYNYNLSVQRELPLGILLDVGMVGSISRHLTSRYPFNEVPFGAAWKASNQDPTKCPNLATCNMNGDNALAANFLRPYTGFSGNSNNTAGYITNFNGNSHYQGLQISANRRVGKNLTGGLTYTWSKALGTQSSYNELQHPTNDHQANYGLLSFDRTQQLTVNYIYNLPSPIKSGMALNNFVTRFLVNDWQVSGITSLSSGAPASITFGYQGVGGTTLNRRLTGSEDWAARPVILSNPNLSGSARKDTAWINTAAVAPAGVGSMGMDSSKYQIRGPGVNNFDISIFKKIMLGKEGQRYIQLRAETYNGLNHTQWSGVYTTATFSPVTGQLTNLYNPAARNRFTSFGSTSGARNPRTMQLAVKLYF